MRLVLVGRRCSRRQSLCAPSSARSPRWWQTYTVFLQSRPIGQESRRRRRAAGRLADPRQQPPRAAARRRHCARPRFATTASGGRPAAADGHDARAGDVRSRRHLRNGQAPDRDLTGRQPVHQDRPVSRPTPSCCRTRFSGRTRRSRAGWWARNRARRSAPTSPRRAKCPCGWTACLAERIETPREAIAATRYALVVANPPPGGEMQLNIWTDCARRPAADERARADARRRARGHRLRGHAHNVVLDAGR